MRSREPSGDASVRGRKISEGVLVNPQNRASCLAGVVLDFSGFKRDHSAVAVVEKRG